VRTTGLWEEKVRGGLRGWGRGVASPFSMTTALSERHLCIHRSRRAATHRRETRWGAGVSSPFGDFLRLACADCDSFSFLTLAAISSRSASSSSSFRPLRILRRALTASSCSFSSDMGDAMATVNGLVLENGVRLREAEMWI
jgi:hypothetical protein